MNSNLSFRWVPFARRGLTLIEVVACLAIGAVLLAATLPLIAAGRSVSRERASLSNLKTLALAHASYAADWGGRQFTNMPDGMSQSGGSYATYVSMFGCPPSTRLGFGAPFPGTSAPAEWAFWLPCEAWVGVPGNFLVLWPMHLGSSIGYVTGFGMCQIQNAVGFNEYVNGRFMDPVFYAPADTRSMSLVGPGLESPNPFTYFSSADDGAWSSYMASPAAMFHPGVFGGDADQTFKPPYEFTAASISPTVDQCAHPDLKSRLIETGWFQSPPFLPFSNTTSPSFNHGADSVPMTLFFDGHAAAMPVRKVLADNDAVVKGGGAELWMDTDITIGPWAGYEGYYSNMAIDDTRTSVHVFTRGGILGRDVTSAP